MLLGRTRAPRVVDEKEPDVRLRARASDASVAVEIKVAEDWTLRELEAAIADNSADSISDREAHDEASSCSFTEGAPRWLEAERVYHPLRPGGGSPAKLAAQIASESSNAPQPQVAMIDVSGSAK